MIKKFISVAFVAAVLSVGVYSYTQSQHEKSMNELTLANVEALADGEGGEGNCYWASREESQGWQAICIDCGVGYSCKCGATKNYY